MPFDFALAISLRVSLISPLHVASSGRVPATSSSFLNAYLRFSKKLTELEERIWDLEREKLSAKKTEKQLARIDPAIGLAFREVTIWATIVKLFTLCYRCHLHLFLGTGPTTKGAIGPGCLPCGQDFSAMAEYPTLAMILKHQKKISANYFHSHATPAQRR
jgi:hypothetical protein